MALSRLQQNSLNNLHRTLEDMSCADRLRQYKSDVPFVHVPIELLAQWSNNRRMLRECDGFAELFTPEQTEAMWRFDEQLREAIAVWTADDIPDVPEVLDEPSWVGLMASAGELQSVLPPARYDLPPS